MRPRDDTRPSGGRRIRVRVATSAFVALAALAACTGDNLFTGPALGETLLGPTVEITGPAAGASILAGDSVQVTAHVSSGNGISQVTFSGVFGTGAAAFISQSVSLSTQDTTLSRFLKQAGTTTGSAKIIVQATDLVGGTAADTVAVTIG